MSKNSRQRMVYTAASLIQRRGVNATSFSEVVAASGAPRGSIYHHFPNGKEQLAAAAVQWTADRILAYQRGCTASTPAGVVEYFAGIWRDTVVSSGATAGCVVAGVAIDTSPESTDLMALVNSAFGSYVDLLAEQLHAVGLHKRRSRSVALACVAGMEGALILCRAERSVKPLDTVTAELKRLAGYGEGVGVAAPIAASRPKSPPKKARDIKRTIRPPTMLR